MNTSDLSLFNPWPAGQVVIALTGAAWPVGHGVNETQ